MKRKSILAGHDLAVGDVDEEQECLFDGNGHGHDEQAAEDRSKRVKESKCKGIFRRWGEKDKHGSEGEKSSCNEHDKLQCVNESTEGLVATDRSNGCQDFCGGEALDRFGERPDNFLELRRGRGLRDVECCFEFTGRAHDDGADVLGVELDLSGAVVAIADDFHGYSFRSREAELLFYDKRCHGASTWDPNSGEKLVGDQGQFVGQLECTEF